MRSAGVLKFLVVASAVGLAALWSTPVVTQGNPQFTQWSAITQIDAGWGTNNFSVYLPGPMVNPSGCSNITGGYTTEAADTGVNLFHTVALSAFLNRKEVAILVLGCSYNKPRLYGINIR